MECENGKNSGDFVWCDIDQRFILYLTNTTRWTCSGAIYLSVTNVLLRFVEFGDEKETFKWLIKIKNF
jgi:hypothetical protein